MPKGQFVLTGISSLARELGVAWGTVKRQLDRGMTPDQIRQVTKERIEKIRAGVPVGRRTPQWLKEELAAKKVAQQAVGQAAGQAAQVDRQVDDVILATDLAAQLRARRLAARSTPDLQPGPSVFVPVGSGPPSSMSPVTREIEVLAEAQRRKETALADKAELDVLQRRGELIPLVQVNAWFAGCIVKARDILLRIGPELRDRLAVETDPVKCEGMVVEEVVRALSQLKELEG